MENWLDYLNYTKLENKTAAQQSLGKILSFTSSLPANRRPSPNDLVYAWALQQSGKEDEAEKFLKNAVLRNTENITGRWVLSAFQNKPLKLEDDEINNENYRVLKKIMETSEK